MLQTDAKTDGPCPLLVLETSFAVGSWGRLSITANAALQALRFSSVKILAFYLRDFVLYVSANGEAPNLQRLTRLRTICAHVPN